MNKHVSKTTVKNNQQAASVSGTSNVVSLQDNRPQSVLQKKANNTGLPDSLKSGIENLSGHSMDDVKVHYNSPQPAQLNAHAYAQGNQIHIASGQEKHLPHEAWHVVQQKQGRVKPTMQMKGKVNVNDDKGLEKEADLMGSKALNQRNALTNQSHISIYTNTIQRQIVITSAEETFSDAAGNLETLAETLTESPEKFGLNEEFVEKLNRSGLSVVSMLKKIDLKNEVFANYRALVKALKSEYMSIDRLSVHAVSEINENIVPDFHPLVNDPSSVQMLPSLFGQNAPQIREILLGRTSAAREAIVAYKLGRAKGDSDSILVMAILAAIELHNSGAIHVSDYSSEEKELQDIAQLPYGTEMRDRLLDDYNLNVYERRAIVAYSFPHKGDMIVAGKWNQYYMGYSPNNWGTQYKDGWAALAGAFTKLPSVGQLGLKVTAYRASRNATESTALSSLSFGTEIQHGKQVMNQGQHHYTSTSLTYSVHNHSGRVGEAQGMMAMHTTSGVYINPFGGFGFLDGAEVLMPPSARTTYIDKKDKGYRSGSGVDAPVFHLDERRPVGNPQDSVNDFDFKRPGSQLEESAERIKEKTRAIEKRIKILAEINRPSIKMVLRKYSIDPDNSHSLELYFLFATMENLIQIEAELQEAYENTTKDELIVKLTALRLTVGIPFFNTIFNYVVKNEVFAAANLVPIQKLQATLDILTLCIGTEQELIMRISNLADNNERLTSMVRDETGTVGLQYVGIPKLKHIIFMLARNDENAYLENVLRL